MATGWGWYWRDWLPKVLCWFGKHDLRFVCWMIAAPGNKSFLSPLCDLQYWVCRNCDKEVYRSAQDNP